MALRDLTLPQMKVLGYLYPDYIRWLPVGALTTACASHTRPAADESQEGPLANNVTTQHTVNGPGIECQLIRVKDLRCYYRRPRTSEFVAGWSFKLEKTQSSHG